jgi:hypothetical protein
MFGHQDNQDNQENTGYNEQPDANQAVAPPSDASAPVAPQEASADPNAAASVGSDDASNNYIMTEPRPVITPPASNDAAPSADSGTDPSAQASAPAAPQDSGTGEANSALLGLKQSALEQLSPLIGHLDQNPEERFRTLMMLIQASDNQSLLQSAYDAAQSIPDEKVRAQALLDVVNEINYFTTQQQ